MQQINEFKDRMADLRKELEAKPLSEGKYLKPPMMSI